MKAFSETEYLARTIYGEARGMPQAAKLAVGWVIRNRLISGRWGSTYKSVVTAPNQFTCWSVNDDPRNYAAIANPSGRAWIESLQAAQTVMAAALSADPLPGVLFYYSPAAQDALHRQMPALYPEKPAFAAPPAIHVQNPPGVPGNAFAFYKNVP